MRELAITVLFLVLPPAVAAHLAVEPVPLPQPAVLSIESPPPKADCLAKTADAEKELKQLEGLSEVRARMVKEGLADLRSACRMGGKSEPGGARYERWQLGRSKLRLAVGNDEPSQARYEREYDDSYHPVVWATERAFEADYDTVWRATVLTLRELKIRPQGMDKDTGLIYLQQDAWVGYWWGSANDVVRRVSTKEVGLTSTWQAVAAEGDLTLKQEGEKTLIRMNLALAGCNGFAGSMVGVQCVWEPLRSNGQIENSIFDAIQRKLNTGSPP